MKTMLMLVMLLVPGVAMAGDWSVIVTGATWHAGDGSARRHQLNPWQHTLGIDYSTEDGWFAQASHMTDSFYCSSNEGAAGRRYHMIGADDWSAGPFIGIAAASRCGADEGKNPAPERIVAPLAGLYAMVGMQVRVEVLVLPTIHGRFLGSDTPLVYAQLEIRI